jgi:HPt (histidine-containing phosphotransfer) domain-containing protein
MMVTNSSDDQNRLDRETILERLEGNQDLLSELVELFLIEAPELIEAMRTALQGGDMRALEHSAHSMKGAAGNFSASSAVSAASQLEKDAKNHDLKAAKESLATLELAIERLMPELAGLRQEPAR